MRIPLPSFNWASGAEVWNSMLEKDSIYSKLKSEKMLNRHPSLVDSYRTILLDWLSEVSQVSKFHRETYHIAMDLIDRYLSAQKNVGKLQLQLIGTTCLFLAAKFEEIRPPTINVFADLTDGACKPEDILDHEVVILETINWEITPVTCNNWLNVYMQVLLDLDKDSFILPANNGILKSKYKRIASVVDLALLHIESLRFKNSILTASALYHFTDDQTVRQCTGYEYHDLAACINWLKPFVETIQDIREPVFVATGEVQLHTHIATVQLLDKVMSKKEHLSLKRKVCSLLEDDNTDSFLLATTEATTLLTPPKRETRKLRRVH